MPLAQQESDFMGISLCIPWLCILGSCDVGLLQLQHLGCMAAHGAMPTGAHAVCSTAVAVLVGSFKVSLLCYTAFMR
jgi:hypothetical protein